MNNETYEVEAHCDNCGHTQPEELLKGTPIHFARGIKCPVCGCEMAFRRKPTRLPKWRDNEIMLKSDK